MSLECKVTDIIPLGTHDMFIADIVAIDVDEELIDNTGKLHLDKADLCAYVHGEYFELGKKLGHIGFSTSKDIKISIKTHSDTYKAAMPQDKDINAKAKTAGAGAKRSEKAANTAKSFRSTNAKQKSKQYNKNNARKVQVKKQNNPQ